MIVWHHDLWKQVLVLGAMGNDEAAPFESQSECQWGIHQLEQGTAHAGACAHAHRIAPGVEVVLVLCRHFGLIHIGVYEAVRGTP